MARVMTVLRSALFAITFYGLSPVFVLAGIAAAPFGHRPIAAVVTAWAWFHRWCTQILLRQRILIEGEPVFGPYLYIIKHESMFETIDIVCLLDRPVVAAKRELLDIPFWGYAAQLYGIIPIEREAGIKAMRVLQRSARQAIADGRPMCLFPEGTRVPHGQRPPLRSGFAGLYGLLGLPVVPVAVDSGRLSPRGHFMKRSGTIRYRFGAVVPPGLPRDEAEARVHAAINALNVPVDSVPDAR